MPAKDYKTIPGPKGLPFFGVLNARPDTLNFYLNARRDFGELTRYVALRKFEWYFVAHPDDIETVMLGSPDVFVKGPAWDRVRLVLGNGLLVSDGDYWRRQRRIVQPVFHRCNHTRFAAEMIEVIAETADRWQAFARSGEAFDMAEEMMRLTLFNVGRTIFGSDMSRFAAPMGQALHVILDYVHLRAVSYEAWRDKKQFETARQALYDLIKQLVDARRQLHRTTHERSGDLLDLMLDARDEETGEPLTEEQLRDELVTLIVAGHETAAVALTWTWYLLSQNPEIATRLRDELDATLGGRLPTMDDLANLPFLKMTVQEGMRLYPPVWAISRQTTREVELRGYLLPPKALLLIFPYVTHRHPEFWDEPDTFDPERFAPERAAGRPKFAYFPFGGGPRMCLGASFAMLETQLIVAIIAQRYFVDVVPNHPVEPALWPSLRLKYGLPVTLRERN